MECSENGGGVEETSNSRRAFSATIERGDDVFTYLAVELGDGKAGLLEFKNGVHESFERSGGYDFAVKYILGQVEVRALAPPEDRGWVNRYQLRDHLLNIIESDIPF